MRAAVIVALSAASLGSANPLVATPSDETSPATNGVDLAWTRGSRDGPVIVMKLGTVFVRHGGEPARAITARGVLAASGGMDTRTLVLQVVPNGQSDLRLFDLRTHRFRQPPRGVNTRAWEWRGSISAGRLLFGRYRVAGNAGVYDILLADLSTGRVRLLDSVRGHAPYAEPGQIAGRYAVWSDCPDDVCSVYRYDLATRKQIRVDGDYSLAAYAPSVTSGGDVYYARGRYGCGTGIELVRYRPGKARRVVADLPVGYDLRFTSTDGKRVLFDRVKCPDGDFDVYGVRVGG